MLFRQLFDSESSTYTYLLADEATREAALIDPVREQLQRDLTVLRELGLKLVYVLDTHVHADHVTAAGLLRAETGARTVGGRKGPSCADLKVSQGEQIRFGEVVIGVLETPGHTDDSLTFQAGNHLFTGDALMIRAAGRTDFQNGDAGVLYDTITRVLFALPDETLVHPAHDYKGLTVTTIGEEKRFNSRVAGRSRAEFIELMNGLHLPKPKKIDEAVPANRACGMVDGRAVRELDPSVLGSRQSATRLIDVRDGAEIDGDGHLPGAQPVPLAALQAAAAEWNRDEAIVIVCKTGVRSARAAADLAALGFNNVATVRGGLEALLKSGVQVERLGRRMP